MLATSSVLEADDGGPPTLTIPCLSYNYRQINTVALTETAAAWHLPIRLIEIFRHRAVRLVKVVWFRVVLTPILASS